jgi:hypothetical protein
MANIKINDLSCHLPEIDLQICIDENSLVIGGYYSLNVLWAIYDGTFVCHPPLLEYDLVL